MDDVKYSDLPQNHYLVGYLDSHNTTSCIEWMDDIERDSYSVLMPTLHINSQGGDIYCAREVYRRMASFYRYRDSSRWIRTRAIGSCMSSAFWIWLHGFHRSCTATTTFMSHLPGTPENCQFENLGVMMNDAHKEVDYIVKIFANYSGQKESWVKRHFFTEKHRLFSPTEAHRLGLLNDPSQSEIEGYSSRSRTGWLSTLNERIERQRRLGK